MYETLILEKSPQGIVTLTLNQPNNRNAMSHRMGEEFQQAIREIGRDPEARFLIVTGKGESFCAGGDFDTVIRDLELPPVNLKAQVQGYYLKFLCLRELAIPTLAAVNGHAAGAGFSLALACDMRIASTRAQFVMSFIRLGIHPGMGATYSLPRAVGTARAFEIFLTGDPVPAQEALSMGLVNRVVEPEDLMPSAMALAQKVASLPQLPIRYMKRSVYMGMKAELMDVLEFESFAQALCSQTEDLTEGIAAFRERRRPKFK